MLITLLLDDKNGLNDALLWNIYYHLYLDEKSLRILDDQAKKLCAIGTSITHWHANKYGSLLRICNQETFTKIREIWGTYSTSDLTKNEKAIYDSRFKAKLQEAWHIRRHQLDKNTGEAKGYQSVAPVGITSLLELPQLNQHYWRYGITAEDPDSLSKHHRPNSMFASLITDPYNLDYLIDPLLSFHLATAFVPLTLDSPLRPKSPGSSQLQKMVEAARIQFQAWSISFRRWLRQNKTLRFFAGDALSFCNTLQHMRISMGDFSAHWYRGLYGLEPLMLDSKDYTTEGNAPLLFNVIDTSNLTDELGAISVLVATSPLLKESISSSIYTESFPPQIGQSHNAWMDGLLGGHYPTVSILLGLVSVEYWTGATAVSTNEEIALRIQRVSTYKRLTWKRLIPPSKEMPHKMPVIQFDEGDLKLILHRIYGKMFWYESVQIWQNPSRSQVQSPTSYHRGSFASFLRCVKDRVNVGWNKVMSSLLNHIAEDFNLATRENHLQELYVQLHVLGVYSMPMFSLRPDHGNQGQRRAWDDDKWKNISESGVVCITLEVPRAELGAITSLTGVDPGISPAHCIVQTECSKNIFEILQIAFGKVTTSGLRDSGDFRVHLTEDGDGWAGSSALIVTFCAPTSVFLHDPQNISITFKTKRLQHCKKAFQKTLGDEMSVFKTSLDDECRVYITKYRPNIASKTAICHVMNAHAKGDDFPEKAIRTTMTANIDRNSARIVSLTGRLYFLAKDIQTEFKNQPTVEVVQISPNTIAVSFDKWDSVYQLQFPIPVQISKSKTRAVHESSYYEMEARMTDISAGETYAFLMYPLSMDGHDPVIWSMPHLRLDSLPIIDTAQCYRLQWLLPHVCTMFVASGRVDRPSAKRDFKDSLYTMFQKFKRFQRVFGINHPTGGGLHIIFFVSCLRIDSANLTVVLDSAVLPLTQQILPQIHTFLAEIPEMAMELIDVDDHTLKIWKLLLPALVERSRQWEHHSSCEYRTHSQIPLSVDFGRPIVCSCGNGKLPPDFIPGVPQWDLISKHAVRAAIAPSFSVHCLEDTPAQDTPQVTSPEKAIANGGASSSAQREEDAEVAVNQCRRYTSRDAINVRHFGHFGRCDQVKYRSTECQVVDLASHKQVRTLSDGEETTETTMITKLAKKWGLRLGRSARDVGIPRM